MDFLHELSALADPDYRDFHAKLIPNIPKDRILGVRVPQLRKLANELYKTRKDEALEFLNELPHEFYDQNNLHAFLVERFTVFENTMKYAERFLPHVDNWATCDMFFPPAFKKRPEEMRQKTVNWMDSDKIYVVRYGIGIVMRMFLENESYDEKLTEKIVEMRSPEYYINMMRAWFLATALAKQRDKILPHVENRVLDVFTHNMTIKKAAESFRIDDSLKAYLKTLKRRP